MKKKRNRKPKQRRCILCLKKKITRWRLDALGNDVCNACYARRERDFNNYLTQHIVSISEIQKKEITGIRRYIRKPFLEESFIQYQKFEESTIPSDEFLDAINLLASDYIIKNKKRNLFCSLHVSSQIALGMLMEEFLKDLIVKNCIKKK